MSIGKNRFFLTGFLFHSFDNTRSIMPTATHSHSLNEPGNVFFNKYYNCIVVQTLSDLLVYSIKDGQLVQLHKDILKSESDDYI